MTKLTTLFLSATLIASAESRSFTGVITDSMCGMNHSHMGVSPDAKCVRECVKGSNGKYKYVLHDGQKAYVLSDQQTPEQFAAQKVKVTGTLYEKTGIIKVERIEAAK
jgi:hypothetical protein